MSDQDPAAEEDKSGSLMSHLVELRDRVVLALHPVPHRRATRLDGLIEQLANRSEGDYEAVRHQLAEEETELTQVRALGSGQLSGIRGAKLRQRQHRGVLQVELVQVRPDHQGVALLECA